MAEIIGMMRKQPKIERNVPGKMLPSEIQIGHATQHIYSTCKYILHFSRWKEFCFKRKGEREWESASTQKWKLINLESLCSGPCDILSKLLWHFSFAVHRFSWSVLMWELVFQKLRFFCPNPQGCIMIFYRGLRGDKTDPGFVEGLRWEN